MNFTNQYDIPYNDIPRGIELSLKNSDRHRADAELLAKNKRYNSAIPLVTLAVEEFGKALYLSEYFEKKESIPDREGIIIFHKHKPKIKKVLDYVENIVKQRTLGTREQDSEDNIFHIPEEYDDQKFKNRMWYVDYQKTQNPKFPWKKQTWKNPLYVEELNFGEGENAEFGILYYKYHDLWRCAYHGIRKFRSSPLYEKILNALQPEELSFDQISSYIERHFFLKESVNLISGDGVSMDIHITPSHQWITPILADIIKAHIRKKCQGMQVNISFEDNGFF